MANPHFSFKRFTIYHDRCAMKVGTDGVLIGSWADIKNAKQILDIGSGTGLIAIMAAQRSQAAITGIEINEEAAAQAQENAEKSPWKDRIHIIHTDIKKFETDTHFDVIISNPPYFTNSLLCPDNKRSVARHCNELSFSELMQQVARLLHPQGSFSVIIPTAEVGELLGLAIANKLYPTRKAWIQTTPKALPKRCMLTFCFTPAEKIEEETIIIETAPQTYSDAYKQLTGEFYIKM